MPVEEEEREVKISDYYYKKSDIDTQMNNKVDKDGNKVLSDNNYTNADKAKLTNMTPADYVTSQSLSSTLSSYVVTSTLNNYYTQDEINNIIPTKTSDLVNDNNFISEEWGTFTELKALIDNASAGDTIVLDKNYRNTDNLNNIITIDKKIHIDGKNHIIDYNNLSNDNTYISITYLAENTSISNCTFANRATNSESLLEINAPCSIINCIFRDNTSSSPPIATISKDVIIKNCIFYNNKGYVTISSPSYNNYITNSLFFKNNGCLRIMRNEKSTPVTVSNCMFIDNNTTYGSIYFTTVNKHNIFDCVFYNNTSSGAATGGAITTYVSSSALPNLVNNKFLTSNDTVYPTTLTNKEYAVGQIPTKTSELTNDSGFLTEHQDISGKEDSSNKVTSWSNTTNDTRYPSEKLVKDSLDNKINTSDIVDNVTTNDATKVLSAKQGKILSEGISSASSGLGQAINGIYSNFNNYQIKDFGSANGNQNVVTNSSGIITIEPKPTVPTKTSDLTNDGSDGTHSFISSDDSRLTDARTPTTHGHGNISSTGFIGGAGGKPLITEAYGKITTGSFGTTSGTFAEGNHTHSQYLTSHQSLSDIGGTVTIEKQQTAESGYIATYVIKQGGIALSPKINIPKDYLVKSASIGTCSTADSPVAGYVVGDKYLDFVINTKDSSETDEHLYILISDLITTSDDNKEDKSNKSSSITTDTGSTTKYPTVKAVEDYAEPKKEVGTFTELITLINNAPAGATITLDKDYINSEGLTGSTNFANEIHIDGNGHILDFNYKNYYFQFSGEKSSIENWIVEHFQYTTFAIVFKNIIIDNCIFRNSNSNLQSVNTLISTSTATNFLMVNCQFYNIQASSLRLITLHGSKQYIKNCIFYSNLCHNVIFSNGGSKLVNNIVSCIFKNNRVYDGVIKHNASDNINNIMDCIFDNNTALSGNGIAINCKQNTVLINNKFITSNDTVYPTTLINKDYLIEHQDISGKANTVDLADVAVSGSYDDLANKPTIPIVPTNVSDFTNDSGYLTSQDISGKENTSNKVTSLSSSSTDTQYPSAKLVYDSLNNKIDASNVDTMTATINYTDNTSETVTFYIVPNNNSS